ncbi:MAG: DUF2752 domain-containing protein [Verrucomicrobiales bacterium]|nr:DUF2752 domain-containing protein [Verrucomicrobiales bacterium]
MSTPSLPPGTTEVPGEGRARRWIPALVWLSVLATLVVLYLHRPEGQFFYPRCTFHRITGLLCPGCGGLRASHALLHGRIAEAVHSNLLVVLSLPAACVGWFAWRRYGKARGWTPGVRTVWWIFGVTTVFTVLRNLPGDASAWLRP